MQNEKMLHMLTACEGYLRAKVPIQTYGNPIHTITFMADHPCSIIRHDDSYALSDDTFFQSDHFIIDKKESVDSYNRIKNIFDNAVAKVLQLDVTKEKNVKVYQNIQGFEEAYRDIEKTFIETFGRTPLGERLDDVLKQALAVHRYTDIANLKEKVGYALTSLLMLTKEANFHPVGFCQLSEKLYNLI